MQMMLRDRDYPELLEELKGRKVLMWTCNTCARLCDVGGRENAEALAGRLREDGVEVVGISSTGASCIASNVRRCREDVPDGYDVVVALTCDIGSQLAGTVFGRPVVNPVETLGTGYRDDSRACIIFGRGGDGDVSLEKEAERLGLDTGPIVRPSSI
ncbi:hypothetical protein [Methanomethylophilus alvi]|uniref:hypothetical protein n=1 Tax=Methanomethylophilus alvi TaxID=1291540 RepID=UPI0037DD5452